MTQSGGDSERFDFGKHEYWSRMPHAELLVRRAEAMRDDSRYCEWDDGEIVSRYSDINWRPVELDMPAFFNHERQLSLAQLDSLARMDNREVVYFYEKVLSDHHFELIDRYRQAHYPELVAPVGETRSQPLETATADVPVAEPPTDQNTEKRSEASAAPTVEEIEGIPEIDDGSTVTDAETGAAEEVETVEGSVLVTVEAVGADFPSVEGTTEPASMPPEVESDPSPVVVEEIEPVLTDGIDEEVAAEEPQPDLSDLEEFLPPLNLPEFGEIIKILDIPIGDEFPPVPVSQETAPAGYGLASPDASELPPEFMPSMVVVEQPQLLPAEKKKFWPAVKAAAQDSVRALGRRLSYWKEKHPDKLWAGGLAGTCLLAIGLAAAFDSESQPAEVTTQYPAVMLELDDTESFFEFNPTTTIAVLGLQQTSAQPDSHLSPAEAVSQPADEPIETAANSEPAARETVPAADPQPAPSAETAPEPVEPERVQSAEADSAAAEATSQQAEQIVLLSSVSLNSNIVNQQLADNQDDLKQQVKTTSQGASSSAKPPKVATKEEKVQPQAAEREYSLTEQQIGWLQAAGTAESDWGHVDFIFTRESSWKWWVWSQIDPNSYGLPQRNFDVHPLRKGEKFMDDPVAQIRWANDYADRRYGGWEKAAAAHARQRWW